MISRKRPESTITGRFLLGYVYMSISSHVRGIGLLPTLPEYDSPSVFLGAGKNLGYFSAGINPVPAEYDLTGSFL